MTQLASLVHRVHWLNWLPQTIIAFKQGILPSILLNLLTNKVPETLRTLANCQGIFSRYTVEKNIQMYYFTFLFVQIFLTVSMSACVVDFLGQVISIESIPVALAQNLHKASNYFYSFVVI